MTTAKKKTVASAPAEKPKAKAKGKKEKVYHTVYTPIGIISFPYLDKPDTGRQCSSNKYSGEIYVPKEVWAKEGKPVVEKVLEVAREFFGKPKIKLSEFKNPFFDMDTARNAEEWQKGTIRIRAKATPENKPVVIGPQKGADGTFPQWSDEEIRTIKGGDYVRLICGVYGYEQQGGGIALGLNFVQFAKVGKALGQGKMAAIKDLDEVEVDVDDPDDMVDTEESAEGDADDDVDPMMKFS